MKLIAKVRPDPTVSGMIVGTVEEREIHRPKYTGDVGYDIEAAEEVLCDPYRITWVSTNLHVEAEHPLWYTILARSSIHTRGGIIPVPVIDSEYQGVLRVPVVALGTAFKINKGERFAQLVFLMHCHPILKVVTEFQPSERGEKGFGSSGT